MSNNPGSVSQSNSGTMFGGQQASIGKRNIQVEISHAFNDSQSLTQSEVVDILTQVDRIVKCSELPGEAKDKTTKYIEAAKVEAAEREPDKELISKNLERVTKQLQEVDRATDAGEKVFTRVLPLIAKIAGWLDVAAKSLLAILP